MKKLKGVLVALIWISSIMSLFSCKPEAVHIDKSSKLHLDTSNHSSFYGPLEVSLYAGHESHVIGTTDGPRLLAQFQDPFGITSSPSGAIYITDQGNFNIRKISPEGIVSTIVFKPVIAPNSITTASDGSLYFIEAGRQRVRRITLDDQIQPPIEICTIGADGARIPFVFNALYDIVVASDGTMYLADVRANTIIKRTTDGIGTIIAGGTEGYKDGKGTDAQFHGPTGIAIGSGGNLYVTDRFNNRVRKIAPDGTVSTIAGSTYGHKDGIGSDAQFWGLNDVIVADHNTLLLVDAPAIRALDLTTRQVTTIAGGPIPGYANGPALSARFSTIQQITIYNNDIYVADLGTRNIRKIAPL
jgi:hypothetical protein